MQKQKTIRNLASYTQKQKVNVLTATQEMQVVGGWMFMRQSNENNKQNKTIDESNDSNFIIGVDMDEI